MQAEALDPAAAARIWEGQLAGALVAEDGGLALSHLAASAAHGFMPKIQTQGQLGHARWRFVSAPSIPGEPFSTNLHILGLTSSVTKWMDLGSRAVRSSPQSISANECEVMATTE